MATKPLRGIHVFWMIFTFFAVVVAVDATFIVRAVNTFPGEQVENSYVLGLDFNREVARREKQSNLGWRAEAGLRSDGGGLLIVRLKSKSDDPVTGLEVSASLHQTGKDDDDRPVALTERAPGEYAAPARITGPARMELSITARKSADQEPVFKAEKTLVIS